MRRAAIYVVTPGGDRARGGIGRMVGYLAREWREREGAAEELRIIDTYGPDRKALMPAYFALALARLAAALATGRVRLLHVNASERGSIWRKGLVVWLGAAFRVPVLVHCHGADFADYCRGLGPARRRLVLATLRRAERLLVLGTHWREFVIRELGIPADRVEVLPNAVPTPPRRNALAPDADASRPVQLLFLGRLGDRKGVPDLLRALAEPRVRELDWTAVLAGDGEIDRFRAEVAAYGLGDRVRIAGWVDEAGAQRLLAASDMLVLPSRNEGLPVAVLEAMAHGLAVVGTPVGAVPDAVVDGESGILVRPGDVAALADALARIIADSALRRSLGEAARARFEARFTVRAHVDRLSEVYAATLAADDSGVGAGRVLAS